MTTDRNKYVLKLTIFSVDSQFCDDKTEINLTFDAPHDIIKLKMCCYSELTKISEMPKEGWKCPHCGNRIYKKRNCWRVKHNG